MKIGIITVEDLNDKKAWSGIVYKMYKQLCTLYGQENISHLRTHIDFWGKVYFFYTVVLHICSVKAGSI